MSTFIWVYITDNTSIKRNFYYNYTLIVLYTSKNNKKIYLTKNIDIVTDWP